MKFEFLILGHPKSGTGYMSKLLECYGYDVPHEKRLGEHGISSWMNVVDDEEYPFPTPYLKGIEFKKVIYTIRDPYKALQSIVNVENNHPESVNFRQKHLQINSLYGYNGAAISYLKWFNLAKERFPKLHIVPVEHAYKIIPEILRIDPIDESKLPKNNVNTRPYTRIPDEEVENQITHPTLKESIRWFYKKWYKTKE